MHRYLHLGFTGFLMLIDLVAPSRELKVTATSEMIGPFEDHQKDEYVTFGYRVSSRTTSIQEEVVLYLASTGEFVHRERKAIHDVNTVHTASFRLLLHDFLSDYGLMIKFQVLKNHTPIASYSATIFPKQSGNFEINGNGVQRITSKDVAFKITNNEVEIYKDDFNFTGFKDYIDADRYYSLDLSQNTFLYNLLVLKCKSAELSIFDEKAVFKYLPHDNGKIKLNLVVVSDGEEKNFEYKDKLYVDRLTLQTSNVKREGFVETNKLFLPVNAKKELIGKEIEINLYECGYSGYNLTFRLTYDVSRELIGNCEQSDYCIKGEIQ